MLNDTFNKDTLMSAKTTLKNECERTFRNHEGCVDTKCNDCALHIAIKCIEKCMKIKTATVKYAVDNEFFELLTESDYHTIDEYTNYIVRNMYSKMGSTAGKAAIVTTESDPERHQTIYKATLEVVDNNNHNNEG